MAEESFYVQSVKRAVSLRRTISLIMMINIIVYLYNVFFTGPCPVPLGTTIGYVSSILLLLIGSVGAARRSKGLLMCYFIINVVLFTFAIASIVIATVTAVALNTNMVTYGESRFYVDSYQFESDSVVEIDLPKKDPFKPKVPGQNVGDRFDEAEHNRPMHSRALRHFNRFAQPLVGGGALHHVVPRRGDIPHHKSHDVPINHVQPPIKQLPNQEESPKQEQITEGEIPDVDDVLPNEPIMYLPNDEEVEDDLSVVVSDEYTLVDTDMYYYYNYYYGASTCDMRTPPPPPSPPVGIALFVLGIVHFVLIIRSLFLAMKTARLIHLAELEQAANANVEAPIKQVEAPASVDSVVEAAATPGNVMASPAYYVYPQFTGQYAPVPTSENVTPGQ